MKKYVLPLISLLLSKAHGPLVQVANQFSENMFFINFAEVNTQVDTN